MEKRSSNSFQIFYPKFNREQIIQLIKERLNHLKRELPILRVVLFGSYARGNYTVASDVDLLVIYDGKPRKKAYEVIKSVFDIPSLEPHPYSQEEHEMMKDTVQRMTRDGITLFDADEPARG